MAGWVTIDKSSTVAVGGSVGAGNRQPGWVQNWRGARDLDVFIIIPLRVRLFQTYPDEDDTMGFN